MKTILLFFFLAAGSSGIACSGFPKSFCQTSAERPNHHVLLGTIVGIGTQSIQLKVLEVLRGSETRSVVSIWDGTDINCTGNISMKASGLGTLSDTILILLPMIVTTENTWDVLGDYRRPHYLYYTPSLLYKNDELQGHINGSTSMSAPYWTLDRAKYSDFKAHWQQNQSACMSLVGIDERHGSAYPRISLSDQAIQVTVPEGRAFQLTLLTVQGQIQGKFEVTQDLRISMTDFPRGLYLVRMQDREDKVIYRKIVW